MKFIFSAMRLKPKQPADKTVCRQNSLPQGKTNHDTISSYRPGAVYTRWKVKCTKKLHVTAGNFPILPVRQAVS